MSGAANRILITGATGFLGRQIAATLVDERPGATLVLLVRGGGRDAAWRRANRLVGLDPRAPVEVLRADITAPRCGLSPDDYDAVVDSTTDIIHSAATVTFNEPYPQAWRINVEGTRQVLELAAATARGGRLRSFTHVSTAFVAGDRSGLVREDELHVGQGFHNTYEHTKAEAEALVHEYADRVPVRIARPSIVVGSSATGSTSSFKMLYWPLRVYATGRWRIVPGYPDAVVDIVPVDFVARAITTLAFDEQAVGGTFHVCAGPDGSTTAGDMARFAASFFHQKPPKFVNPLLFLSIVRPVAFLFLPRRTARILREGRVYRPYFRTQARFDTTRARQLLEPKGVTPPKVVDYLERLFRFCVDSDWGRRSAKASRRGPAR